jgi:diacylglycerol kinase family enzyme
VDLASVNERVFVNNASLGVYARIVQSDAYRDSKLGTWRRMLPEMLGKDADTGGLQFRTPQAKDWSNATLVIVSNNPYQLKRLRGVGTRPRMDTGHLGIFATRMHNARSVAKLVTLGTIGQHRRFGSALQWSSVDFEIQSGALVAVGLDGEALMLAPPLRFLSLPGALRVRVPRHAHGISPARRAVPLTPRNVWALTRIAAGRPAQT